MLQLVEEIILIRLLLLINGKNMKLENRINWICNGKCRADTYVCLRARHLLVLHLHFMLHELDFL